MARRGKKKADAEGFQLDDELRVTVHGPFTLVRSVDGGLVVAGFGIVRVFMPVESEEEGAALIAEFSRGQEGRR